MRPFSAQLAEYGVGGIPHFVFLDKANAPLAATVGRAPRQVLEGAWVKEGARFYHGGGTEGVFIGFVLRGARSCQGRA